MKKYIEVRKDKCNGCGRCIGVCAGGAMRYVDREAWEKHPEPCVYVWDNDLNIPVYLCATQVHEFCIDCGNCVQLDCGALIIKGGW